MRSKENVIEKGIRMYESPYIPLGPFKLRLPGIHYKI